MRRTPSKNSSKFWETADEINFLEHIESWGIQKGNPITMLKRYTQLGSRDWGLVNRGKAGRIEAHHHDYDYPLEVIWCCPVCHAAIHKDLRERGIDLHK